MNHAGTHERFRTRYGPWAVVTGASSGIGRECAILLAEYGLNLVLVARSKDVLEELAANLSARHSVQIRILPADLATEDGVQQVIDSTRELDVGLLVASAGYGVSGPFLNTPLEQHRDLLAVNGWGSLSLTWEFGRRFTERGRGGLVLFSSIVGFQGVPWATHYAATKAFIQSLAEGLSRELASSGVDVLSVAPGPTATGFHARANLKEGMATSAATVARATLNALGRHTTIHPGWLTKLLTYSMLPLPRWAKVRIMGQVMHGMANHPSATPTTSRV